MCVCVLAQECRVIVESGGLMAGVAVVVVGGALKSAALAAANSVNLRQREWVGASTGVPCLLMLMLQ